MEPIDLAYKLHYPGPPNVLLVKYGQGLFISFLLSMWKQAW